jgi:hypothetical protein
MAHVRQQQRGVMLVTVWSDGAGPEGVRARVVLCADVTTDEREEIVVAGRDALVARLAAWLDQWSSREPSG